MTFLRLKLRAAFALGAIACALLLAFGYYLQYAKGLEPCPLCLVQRGFFYLVMAAFLVGALHGRAFLFHGVLAAVFAAGGAATAGRQVWLQHLPADRVPECGPDLAFMLEYFPLAETIGRLFAGSGECAVVDWTFLGLSIAEWALGWFCALGAYAVWLSFSKTLSARGRI